MDSLQRVIRLSLWFSVGVLLSAWTIFAHAASCSTVLANCNTAWAPYNCKIYTTTPPHVSSVQANGSEWSLYGSCTYDTCPAGQSIGADGLCHPPPCVAGQAQSTGVYDMATSPTAAPAHTACDNGCSTEFQGSFPVGRTLVGGVYHYFGSGSWVKNGSTCTTGTGSPSSAASIPAPACASGQTLINDLTAGTQRCIGSGGTPVNPNAAPAPNTKTEAPTVSNPDGSTSQTTTAQNPDGSTTTTTKTTQPDGTIITNTTTANPDGSAKDPMGDFCKSNPASPMCKGQDPFCQSNPDSIVCKKSSFGGSCGAFSCDGDAVQCAIAKKQYEENCTLFVTATPLSDLGGQVASGADPQQGAIDTLKTGTTTDIQSQFTAAQGARWLGSADIPDVHIAAMGRDFVLPMSNYSNFFRSLGYLFVAVASIIGVRMVSSTVTS